MAQVACFRYTLSTKSIIPSERTETYLPARRAIGNLPLLHPQADRRERDAQAIKAFEAGVATISEEMEQRVLEASYALREGLEEAEQAVNAVREELNVDDCLVQGDMAYVEVAYFHGISGA